MVILRRTSRLQSQLPETRAAYADSDTALGDCYANRIVVHRTPLLLLISSKSLLPLVLPARDVRTLPDRLASVVRRRLAGLGLAAAVVEAEVSAMVPVVVAKTADRSVLGILVDFAKGAPYYLPERRSSDADLLALETRLEETPCYTSLPFEKVIFPREKTEELLRQRWLSGKGPR